MLKALLVDTNFSSWPILEALEKRGFEVHVVGNNPQDTLARQCKHYHELDYSDACALSGLLDELQPDCLVPGCNDRSYIACADVAQGRGFFGIDSPETALAIHQKGRFREVALKLRLSMPRVVSWPDNAPKWAVIVKPVDAFSGKGVTLVTNPSPQGIEAARRGAIGVSRCGQCIVEEYVEGQMYSHSAFITSRRIVRDFWVIEHSGANPFVVDTSHLDLDLDNAIKDNLRLEIESLADALELTDGLIHTQFIVSGSRFVIIELTRRCPGDLYSQLIQQATGFNYSDAYVSSFTGELVAGVDFMPKFILRHTLTGITSMRLQHVSFNFPLKINRWVPLATCADELKPSPNGRIGIMFLHAEDPIVLKELAMRAYRRELFEVNLKVF